VPLSKRGEYELPEAVGLAVANGVTFKTVPASGAVLDLSRPSDVALVSQRLAGLEPHP
jgi:dTDP-glucose pyrophosphorylase